MDNFSIVEVESWYDIGNIDSLKKTRDNIKGTVHVLDKEDENIFVFDDYVIKFFYNKKICSDRVARTKNLKGLVPELLDATENFYKYKFVEANLMADSVNLIKFINLLTWARDTLWIKKEDESYRQNALAFYKDKTLKRVDKFLNKYNIEDEPDVINGIEVPSIKDMIHEIEFDYLIGKNPTGFHGDFILDNILIDDKKFINSL